MPTRPPRSPARRPAGSTRLPPRASSTRTRLPTGSRPSRSARPASEAPPDLGAVPIAGAAPVSFQDRTTLGGPRRADFHDRRGQGERRVVAATLHLQVGRGDRSYRPHQTAGRPSPKLGAQDAEL